jgi:hypothetical protein
MLSAKGHRRQPNPDHCRRVMIKVSTCFALVRQEDILEALRCHEGSGRPDDDRDDAMRPRSTVWPPCVRDNPSLTFSCDHPWCAFMSMTLPPVFAKDLLFLGVSHSIRTKRRQKCGGETTRTRTR